MRKDPLSLGYIRGTFEGANPKEKDPSPAILLLLTKNEYGSFVLRSREKY